VAFVFVVQAEFWIASPPLTEFADWSSGSGRMVGNPDMTPFFSPTFVWVVNHPLAPSLAETWRHARLILMTKPFDADCAAQRVDPRMRRGRVAMLLAKRQG
jgi:hypothetical protein